MTMKKTEPHAAHGTAEILGKLVGALLLLGASLLWRGYVLSLLWRWLAVPAFGLPALSVPLSMGVVVVTAFLCKTLSPATERKTFFYYFGAALFTPLLFLGMGWVVAQFV